MNITVTVTDLDRLVHALLLAKIDYVCDAVENTSGARWDSAKLNIDALRELYDQLNRALVTLEGWTHV